MNQPEKESPNKEITPKKPCCKKACLFLCLIVIFLLGGAGGYLLGAGKVNVIPAPTPATSNQVACTMEAKLCPDGTSVGRVGPNCEFAPCPTSSPISDFASGWRIHTDKVYGFEFKFPTAWEDFGSGDSSGYFKTESGNTLNLNIDINSASTISEYLENRDKLTATSYEGAPAYQVQSTKKSQINGLNFIQRTEYMAAADMTRISTYFKKDNHFITLSLTPVPGNSLENDKIFYDQILSTFRFTQENKN